MVVLCACTDVLQERLRCLTYSGGSRSVVMGGSPRSALIARTVRVLPVAHPRICRRPPAGIVGEGCADDEYPSDTRFITCDQAALRLWYKARTRGSARENFWRPAPTLASGSANPRER